MPDEKKGLVARHRNWEAYQTAFRRVLGATKAQDPDKATRVYFAAAGPLYGKVAGDLKHLGQVNDREAENSTPTSSHGRLGAHAGADPAARLAGHRGGRVVVDRSRDQARRA